MKKNGTPQIHSIRTSRVPWAVVGAIGGLLVLGGALAFGLLGSSTPTSHPLVAKSAVSAGSTGISKAEAAGIAVSTKAATDPVLATCDGQRGVIVAVCERWEALSPSQMAVVSAENKASFAPVSVTISSNGLTATVTGCILSTFHDEPGMWWSPGLWVSTRASTAASWATAPITRSSADRRLSCKAF